MTSKKKKKSEEANAATELKTKEKRTAKGNEAQTPLDVGVAVP